MGQSLVQNSLPVMADAMKRDARTGSRIGRKAVVIARKSLDRRAF